jgi:hypothetical protein
MREVGADDDDDDDLLQKFSIKNQDERTTTP